MKKNLLNIRFTLLLVKEKYDEDKWLCLCDCGNSKIVKHSYLLNKDTKSCGCLATTVKKQHMKQVGEKSRKYDTLISSARGVYQRYKDGDLSFDDFYKLSQQNCYYCNQKPYMLFNAAKNRKSYSEKSKLAESFIYNGLDRVDSSLPHNKNNVVPCCRTCNFYEN